MIGVGSQSTPGDSKSSGEQTVEETYMQIKCLPRMPNVYSGFEYLLSRCSLVKKMSYLCAFAFDFAPDTSLGYILHSTNKEQKKQCSYKKIYPLDLISGWYIQQHPQPQEVEQ